MVLCISGIGSLDINSSNCNQKYSRVPFQPKEEFSVLSLIRVHLGYLTHSFISFRLLTGECDKTIKIWKEDETATPETHPVADISMQFD